MIPLGHKERIKKRKCASPSLPSMFASVVAVFVLLAHLSEAAPWTANEEGRRPGQAEEALGEEQSTAVIQAALDNLGGEQNVRRKRSAEAQGYSLPDLGSISPDEFLDFVRRHYVLIKTKDGYVLGRNMNRGTRSGPVQLRERRYPSSDSNFQLRVRKKSELRRRFGSDNNFQLRVRKRAGSGFPVNNNFQLRVRKQPLSAFAGGADRNFQLRVRRPYLGASDAGSNFQLRVRKGYPGTDRNFQLRVRKANLPARVVKAYPASDRNFQLRVRKSDPAATMEEQEEMDERLRFLANALDSEDVEGRQEAKREDEEEDEYAA